MTDPDPLHVQLQRARHLTVYAPTSRKSPFRALFIEVLLPVAAAFACTISGITGGAVAILTADLYQAIAGLALAIGSLIAGVFLAVQLRRYHERMFIVKEWDLDPAGDENPETGPRQIVANGGNGGQRIVTFPRGGKWLRYGNIEFFVAGKNLDALKTRYAEGHTTIRKETSPAGPGFDTLPEPITGGRYSSARAALIGLGFVTDSQPGEWTPAGVGWLNED